MRRGAIMVGLGVALAMPTWAHAGLSDWELSEVHRSSDGDDDLRFVELVNEEGGCLFPASTVDLYDAAGTLLDTQSLTVVTVCHGAPTYLLLATSAAATYFGVPRDGNLSTGLPASGQLCFSSSQTNYDCFRWGTVASPVVDLFGANDTSAISPALDGQSMSRVSSDHIVATDWAVASPTPRQPNDGSLWDPPDAGPIFDAGPVFDAGPRPDAARRSDAGPRSDAGARVDDPAYLDLDTVGGASCACQGSGPSGPSWGALWLLMALLPLRRRRT